MAASLNSVLIEFPAARICLLIMAAQPQRKRIVPQQVITPASPTGPLLSSLAPFQVTDLSQQAELAPQLLGPGRKIWWDLNTGQDVSWKKASPPAGKPAAAGAFPQGLTLQGSAQRFELRLLHERTARVQLLKERGIKPAELKQAAHGLQLPEDGGGGGAGGGPADPLANRVGVRCLALRHAIPAMPAIFLPVWCVCGTRHGWQPW